MIFPVINTAPLTLALRLKGQWLNWSKSSPPVPAAASAAPVQATPVWETPFNPTAHLQACAASADFPVFQEATIDDTIVSQADSIVIFAAGKPIDVIAVPRSVLAPPAPVVAPLIGDPGFEQVQAGVGKYLYTPPGTPWTFTGNAGVTANGSGFTYGNPPAPEGNQAAFLQVVGSFSQVVPGWPTGFYVLTFKAAQRGKGQATKQDFAVLIDGAVVGTFAPGSGSYQDCTTSMFYVSPGSHTITFQGLDTATGDNTAFIDAVIPIILR